MTSSPKQNPYNAETPIEASEMFFGRAEALDVIVEKRIRHAHPISTILIGGRKIGKTSLLHQIRNRLVQQPACGNDIAIPVFISFHSRASWDIVTVFEEIASELARSLRANKGIQAHLETTTGDPYKVFCQRLQTLWNQCSERIGSVRFVILLDEADRLLGHSWTPDVISNLRDLINTSSLKSFVALVVTGFRELHDYAMTEEIGIGSALGNAARWTSLSVLTETECRDLITLPVNGGVEAKVVNAVYEQSGGHPYLTQYLMQQIWKPDPASITLDSVSAACKQFGKDTRVFPSWQEKFDDLDSRVYCTLAQEKKPQTLMEIHKQAKDYAEPGEVEDSLDFLVYTGVIATQDDKYHIAGTLYRDWFLARFSSDEKENSGKTPKTPQSKKDFDIGFLLTSVFVVLLIFAVTIAILVWASQQVPSAIVFAIILVVAIVFDLVSIVTMLAMNNFLPKKWTTSFYDNVLSKIPILDFSKYFQNSPDTQQAEDPQNPETSPDEQSII